MREVELSSVEGVRWLPDRFAGVGALVLAGSSGRVDSARAELLARHGAVAESIRWFGAAGQHEGPWEIPMELFLDRLDDLARECDRLVVIGTSFGSEAALLAGALHPRADAVIAFAPSDVTWAGVRPDGSLTSHWTFDGAPLPFVPLDDTWEPDDQTPAYVGLYEASRQRFSDRASDAAIPVERVREVVLVAGGDDQVWPAVAMARSIEARRLDRGLRTVVVTDPEAGHRTVLPGEPVVTGGTDMRRGGHARADRRLGEAAWTHVREIIQVHHLDRPAASGGRSARAVESGRDPE